MRARPILALASVAAASSAAVSVLPASAAAPASGACAKDAIVAAASSKDAEGVQFAVENGGGVVSTCRDLNGDGKKDALFTVQGGGTGGAFSGGIVTDRGNGPVLAAWVTGHSKTSAGFRKGRPALAYPVFRKGEPDCCATGGWRVRRFAPSGTGFKALPLQKLKSNKYPLTAKP
ncbi:hypothetical protein [Patulibacter minatonensis]|uniref:hypothetical protein n=1 Tax=Patulibacter minatonensis TaxID=298163 RepID=UPI00047D31F6|nr:hypothetical protein [Patulibacter minatonensis]